MDFSRTSAGRWDEQEQIEKMINILINRERKQYLRSTAKAVSSLITTDDFLINVIPFCD
jgi:hypothetical protein